MVEPRIITYNSIYRQSFINLNMEWLDKYFTVEPHDKKVFENLEKVVLEPGGEIFFCIVDNTAVGTVAMQKVNEKAFELAKMAITQEYQGRGLSNLLMERCIAFAREKNLAKIILVSNRSLTSAIGLYSKFGFKETPLDETDYSRADIQMELLLK